MHRTRSSNRRRDVALVRLTVAAFVIAAAVCSEASAQTKPATQKAATQVPLQLRRATLSVDKPTIQVGDLATFALSPPEIATDPAFMWTMKWTDLESTAKQQGSASVTGMCHGPGDVAVTVSAERVVDEDILEAISIVVNAVSVHVVGRCPRRLGVAKRIRNTPGEGARRRD